MWLRRSRNEEKRLAAELEFHMEQSVRDLVAAGMAPTEARRKARLEFGGIEQIKEECRDIRSIRWLRDLAQDLRYALRMLRRSPAFLTVAVLSLALGIGANTAIFTLIDAVMLRPLPVRDPARLVQLQRMRGGDAGRFSYPLFEYVREHARSFSGVFAVEDNTGMAVAFQDAEEKVSVDLVSGSDASVLGLRPAAGRFLGPEDDGAPGSSPVAVLGFRYWQRRFGGDPSVIGKSFTLGSTAFSIIGVAPAEFAGTVPGTDPDLTVPLAMHERVRGVRNIRQRPGYSSLWVMARLKPGVSIAQAGAEARVLFEALLQQQASKAPDQKARNEILRQTMNVVPAATGFDGLRSRFSRPLLVLMGIVTLVLLLACANLSGLLLARAASRHREVSIRGAMGAGQGRLLRQFLAESLLLVVLGGAGGLLLARWLCLALVSTMANGGRMALPIQPDWRVLLFAGVIAALTCILVGCAPGLHAARGNAKPGLREVRRNPGRALIVTQLAISMVLVVGASLFLRTLIHLQSLDAGFRRDGILDLPPGDQAKIHRGPQRGVAATDSGTAQLPSGSHVRRRGIPPDDRRRPEHFRDHSRRTPGANRRI